MALVVCQQVETKIPIEVIGITPEALAGKSNQQISKIPIRHGRHDVELGQLFKVSGSLGDSMTLVFDGLLDAVHWIGAGQQGGACLIYTSPSPRDKRQSRMPSSA